jgi:hypothetical protein
MEVLHPYLLIRQKVVLVSNYGRFDAAILIDDIVYLKGTAKDLFLFSHFLVSETDQLPHVLSHVLDHVVLIAKEDHDILHVDELGGAEVCH